MLRSYVLNHQTGRLSQNFIHTFTELDDGKKLTGKPFIYIFTGKNPWFPVFDFPLNLPSGTLT